MARNLSDILRRFRPTVAPGPAGPAGVPVDRVAEAGAELAVVFAALEPTVVEAGRLREQARVTAEQCRRQAVVEADQIIAAARARLDAVRAQAASGHLAAVDQERVKLERDARTEAERVRLTAEARLGDVVTMVLDGVWATARLSAGAVVPGNGSEPPG